MITNRNERGVAAGIQIVRDHFELLNGTQNLQPSSASPAPSNKGLRGKPSPPPAPWQRSQNNNKVKITPATPNSRPAVLPKPKSKPPEQGMFPPPPNPHRAMRRNTTVKPCIPSKPKLTPVIQMGSPQNSSFSSFSEEEPNGFIEKFEQKTEDDLFSVDLLPYSDEPVQCERLRLLSCAAREIFKHETKFADNLNGIIKSFGNLIRDFENKPETRGIAETFRTLLKYLTKIRNSHSLLLDLMVEKSRDWRDKLIEPDFASCIEQEAPKFIVCKEFLVNKDRFVSELRTVLEKPGLESAAAKVREVKLGNIPAIFQLDIVHQNLAQYEILLKSYKKYLYPDTDEDRRTESAIHAVNKIVNEINDSMEEEIMRRKQSELAVRLEKFEPYKGERRLKYEGDVKMIVKNVFKAIYLILFSDVLLITKTSQNSTEKIYSQKEIKMDSVIAEPEKHIERETYFVLRFVSDDNTKNNKNITFVAEHKTERDKWVSLINKVSTAIPQEYGSAESDTLSAFSGSSNFTNLDLKMMATYISDDRTTRCMMQGCTVKFGRREKPHCQHCGWIICDRCTGYAPFKHATMPEFKVGKVCAECYDLILDKFQKCELFPDELLDKTKRENSRCMDGVRVFLEQRWRNWKELFKAPPGGIRPKISIENTSVVSGTVFFKTKIGVEKERWARLQSDFNKYIIEFCEAELDESCESFDLTSSKINSTDVKGGGCSFEIRCGKEKVVFRVPHSGNSVRWKNALDTVSENEVSVS